MTKRLDINDELLIHGRDAVLARDAAATVVHSPAWTAAGYGVSPEGAHRRPKVLTFLT